MNVFEKALEIIDECGWTQGEDIAPGGERCLVKAWEEAEALLHPWGERRLERSRARRVDAHRARHDREDAALRAAIDEVNGGRFCARPWVWNDDRARSEEAVRLVLKLAARNLEA